MTASPVSSRRWLKPVAITMIVVFVVAMIGYAYASPYIALNRLKQAADARDAATLNQYVDYPALRGSLKEEVGEMLQKRIGAEHSSNPLLLFGAVIGAALIGPLVDAYATPDGVAALLNGMPPRGEPGERPPATPGTPAAPGQDVPPPAAPAQAQPAPPPVASATAPESRPQTTAGYRGINEFVVTWRHGADEPRYAAILQRHGLFSWKLAAVELNDAN
ncbi:DUF2939 domain-containing protein [Paraburkholderia caballeronis]|uniref:DUF2939 domain-containing protein n=1 Tax=Paraburkholderia caballeronis TaxID=416943 RepID=UPI001065DF40|nr:DUF2939 domain-containing protein [Paraburkholderia caballeronis]